MASDSQSMPLPILLRVPWFPPDPLPAVIVPQVRPVEDAGTRSFPLVIQRNFRAAPSPWRARSTGRYKRWIVIVALTALLGGVVAWHNWAGESAEEGTPAGTPPEVRLEPSPSRTGGTTPRRAARLSPEIIPLDAGETP